MLAGVATGSMLLAAKHSRHSAKARDDPPVLRVLGGSQYFENGLVDDFLDQTGVSIEVTPTAAPDDVPLFLQADGVGLYDLAITTNGLVRSLGQSGLTQSVISNEFSSAANLFPQFQSPDWLMSSGQQFGMPVLWGSLAAAFPTERDVQPPDLWLDLFDERFKKQVIMSDDVLGHFWIWGRAMGAEDPTLVTRDQLEQTRDLLIRLKLEQARSLESSIYAAMKKMARGRGLVSSVGWQTASLIPSPDEQPLAATQPGPGSASFCDCFAVVADAPHRDTALALIDYFLSPQPQANLVNALNWATVSAASVDLLKPELRGLFDYEDLDRAFEVSPILGYPPMGETPEGYATYLDWTVAWDQIRIAKKE